ncbi:unnamed protein product, partial [Closterium sp. NIES-64]
MIVHCDLRDLHNEEHVDEPVPRHGSAAAPVAGVVSGRRLEGQYSLQINGHSHHPSTCIAPACHLPLPDSPSNITPSTGGTVAATTPIPTPPTPATPTTTTISYPKPVSSEQAADDDGDGDGDGVDGDADHGGADDGELEEAVSRTARIQQIVNSDGFNWLKYGEKRASASRSTIRAYYKCVWSRAESSPCRACKVVEIDPSSKVTPSTLHTRYMYTHNHETPGQCPRKLRRKPKKNLASKNYHLTHPGSSTAARKRGNRSNWCTGSEGSAHTNTTTMSHNNAVWSSAMAAGAVKEEKLEVGPPPYREATPMALVPRRILPAPAAMTGTGTTCGFLQSGGHAPSASASPNGRGGIIVDNRMLLGRTTASASAALAAAAAAAPASAASVAVTDAPATAAAAARAGLCSLQGAAAALLSSENSGRGGGKSGRGGGKIGRGGDKTGRGSDKGSRGGDKSCGLLNPTASQPSGMQLVPMQHHPVNTGLAASAGIQVAATAGTE